MNRIYKKIEETKAQYKYGLINKKEMEQILASLRIELMGCDCL